MKIDLSRMTSGELFEKGLFTEVIRRGDNSDWRTFAARGLIGQSAEALEGLARFEESSEVMFYKGVAMWIDGRDDESRDVLRRSGSPKAGPLLRLVEKPRIDVLAQLTWDSVPFLNLDSGIAADPKFNVRNINVKGSLPHVSPYMNAHEFYDPESPPDFFFSAMLEWHLTPENINELPCPVFGHTSDIDAHIQCVHPVYQKFDAIMTTGAEEYAELACSYDGPSYTYPKVFSVRPGLGPASGLAERKYDFFASGTLHNPFHPDKAAIVSALLKDRDLCGKSRIINGFLPAEDYFRYLGESRSTFTFVRHHTSMPTRALEALAHGVCAIVQRECVLTLYMSEEHGVFTYDSTGDSLREAVRRINENAGMFDGRAQKGREAIRRDFNPEKVASQYFRFLAFLASQTGKRADVGASAPSRVFFQKRLTTTPPVMSSEMTCHKLLLENLRRYNAAGMRVLNPADQCDIVRELLLSHVNRRFKSKSFRFSSDGLLGELFKRAKAACEVFPESLVLRFNFVRALLHFGGGRAAREAVDLCREMLGRDLSCWRMNPLEDVMPWDFLNGSFNYRDYFQCCLLSLSGRPTGDRMARLILASTSLHLYSQSGDVEDARAAVRHDPDFPNYRFEYALALLREKRRGCLREAKDILEELADSSVLRDEAAAILDGLGKGSGGRKKSSSFHRCRAVANFWERMEIPRRRPAREGIRLSGRAEDVIASPVSKRYFENVCELTPNCFFVVPRLLERPGGRVFIFTETILERRIAREIFSRQDPQHRVAGIVDDMFASRSRTYCGLPALSLEEAAMEFGDGGDASVVVFSDTSILGNPPDRVGPLRKSLGTAAFAPVRGGYYYDTRPFYAVMEELDRMCRQFSLERLLLYGAGRHCRKVMRAAEGKSFRIVGVVDDHLAGGEIGGFRIGSPGKLDESEYDAVLINSDAWEQILFEKARQLRQGKPLLRLYSPCAEVLDKDYEGYVVRWQDGDFWASKLVGGLLNDINLLGDQALGELEARGLVIHNPDLGRLKEIISTERAKFAGQLGSRLRELGLRRVALYGAGKFCARLLKALWKAPHPVEVCCVLDDCPARRDIGGVPIVVPVRAVDFSFDAVVVSTETFMEEMAAKARGWAWLTRPVMTLPGILKDGRGWP